MIEKNEDLVYKYYADIAKCEPLSREEETRLILLAQDGDINAYEAIITANLKFVVKIAKMFQNQGHPLSDLISEGNLGLINAVHRFDTTSGNKFISYAVWWIREAINSALNETSRSVRLPVNLIMKIKKNKKFVDKFINEHQIKPSVGDILENGEVVDKYLLPDAYTDLHLDDETKGNGEGDLTYSDILMVEPDEVTDDDVKIKNELLQLLSELSDREQNILCKYFGLDGEDGMTLLEISKIYGLTIERVRQIKEKAIRKLRHNSSRLFHLINDK